MGGEVKKFRLDTVVSVMMGKFLSPEAESEYHSLCAHLFKDNPVPKTPGDQAASVSDVPAQVRFGLIHTLPELCNKIESVLQESTHNSLAEAYSNIQKAVSKSSGQFSDQVEIAPFDAETTRKIANANPYLQSISANIRQIEMQTGAFVMPTEDVVGKVANMQTVETPRYQPSNITNEEISGLQKFDGLVFAEEVQKNILSIAKAAKIPVTPNSFKQLRIKDGESTKMLLGIDVSQAGYEELTKHLQEAGIGDFVRQAKSKDSDRRMIAVDVAKLDDSFFAQSNLSEYRSKMAEPSHGQGY